MQGVWEIKIQIIRAKTRSQELKCAGQGCRRRSSYVSASARIKNVVVVVAKRVRQLSLSSNKGRGCFKLRTSQTLSRAKPGFPESNLWAENVSAEQVRSRAAKARGALKLLGESRLSREYEPGLSQKSKESKPWAENVGGGGAEEVREWPKSVRRTCAFACTGITAWVQGVRLK